MATCVHRVARRAIDRVAAIGAEVARRILKISTRFRAAPHSFRVVVLVAST